MSLSWQSLLGSRVSQMRCRSMLGVSRFGLNGAGCRLSNTDECRGSRWRRLTTAQTVICSHVRYMEHVIGGPVPGSFQMFKACLGAKGYRILSPTPMEGSRDIHPLVLPVARNEETGDVIGLLRWIRPEAMTKVSPQSVLDSIGGDSELTPEMPVVSSRGGSLTLLGNSAIEYVHRALAEECCQGGPGILYEACKDSVSAHPSSGETLVSLPYAPGAVQRVMNGDIDKYLIAKVGNFLDAFESLATRHSRRGDDTAALITLELACRRLKGWAEAPWAHSKLLYSLGRLDEARDSARVALSMPLWTFHSVENLNEVYEMAGFTGFNLDSEYKSVDDKLITHFTNAEQSISESENLSPKEEALSQAIKLMDKVAYSYCSSSVQSGDADGPWWYVRDELAALFFKAGENGIANLVKGTSSLGP